MATGIQGDLNGDDGREQRVAAAPLVTEWCWEETWTLWGGKEIQLHFWFEGESALSSSFPPSEGEISLGCDPDLQALQVCRQPGVTTMKSTHRLRGTSSPA